MHRRLVRFILRRRLLVVGLMAAATVGLGWQAAQVEFDNSIETYFREDDIEEYRRFLDQFGTDEILAVAFEDGRPLEDPGSRRRPGGRGPG